jgi:sulfate adenylyltransferase subunit 1
MMKNNTKILRFTTVGSVDDGKSTLIGRLLLDSKSTFDDQLNSIERSSRKKGFDFLDLSLLTDGLKSEREQGITIDVAYRYFSTKKRKFIVADTPGHIQYTRNMVTGASTANLALIIIDITKGISEQTLRHTYISSLLGISHAIVCINKMDLINYDQKAFNSIIENFKKIKSKIKIDDIKFVPISALIGENIIKKSSKMKWYNGKALIQYLEDIEISHNKIYNYPRFPIQCAIRPQTFKQDNFRGFAGRIEGGIFKPNDKIKILPSGHSSKIKNIQFDGRILNEAFSPMSVIMTIEDDIDIGRGDMIVKEDSLPIVTKEIDLIVTWMSSSSLENKKKVIIKHTTRETLAIIDSISYKINIDNFENIENIKCLKMNDIGKISIKTSSPINIDKYENNRNTGSLIIIDINTNETIGAGIII